MYAVDSFVCWGRKKGKCSINNGLHLKVNWVAKKSINSETLLFFLFTSFQISNLSWFKKDYWTKVIEVLSIVLTIALIQSLLIESLSSYIYTDLATQSVEDDFIFRSHVPVHLFTCEEKALKCEVKGCNNYVKKRHEFLHDRQYEQSHQVLLKSEVEILRCSMFEQVCIPFTCLPVSPFDGFRYGWMDGWWNE